MHESYIEMGPILPAREKKELEFKDVLQVAQELKEEGNLKVKFDQYYYAIQSYEKALEVLEEANTIIRKEEVNVRAVLQYKLLSNIALCHLRVDEPAQATVACQAALDLNVKNTAKLYYRYAEANFLLKIYDDAAKYIELALQFDQKCYAFLEMAQQIHLHKSAEDNECRELYKKMAKGIMGYE